MTTVKEFNSYGEELEKLLMLRTAPIAVKMLEKEADIPQEAVRPKRDRGYHLAQCQAFAMTRRKREAIAMLKEDNWCWAPLIGYGLVEGLQFFEKMKMGYRHFNMQMTPDFPQPDFYKELFKMWGLDVAE